MHRHFINHITSILQTSSSSTYELLCLFFLEFKVQSPGVFLLRFSESKPGQIVISYTDKVITEIEKSEINSNSNISNRDNTSNKHIDNENNAIQSERIIKSSVGHCLVDIEENSFVLRLSNNVKKYDSLKHLLMDCKKLKYFYPSFPKATAFECLDNV